MSDQTHKANVWRAIQDFHNGDRGDRGTKKDERGQLDFCRRCGCYLRPSEGRFCADCQQETEVQQ